MGSWEFCGTREFCGTPQPGLQTGVGGAQLRVLWHTTAWDANWGKGGSWEFCGTPQPGMQTGRQLEVLQHPTA